MNMAMDQRSWNCPSTKYKEELAGVDTIENGLTAKLNIKMYLSHLETQSELGVV